MINNRNLKFLKNYFNWFDLYSYFAETCLRTAHYKNIYSLLSSIEEFLRNCSFKFY